jgi:SHS2 domain-containing protein
MRADIGVRGCGSTLADAFAGAATALTSVICDPERIADHAAVTVECAAPDDELLLVDWLNALIYEMATRAHAVFAIRRRHRESPSDGHCLGRADRHLAPSAGGRGQGGASFCELAVGRQADGRWLAQCVVDV